MVTRVDVYDSQQPPKTRVGGAGYVYIPTHTQSHTLANKKRNDIARRR